MMMHTQVTSNQEFTYAAELGKLKAKTENLKQRNRESAKASRDRKKAQLDALSAQIDELTANNLKLAQTCQDVAIENKKLKVDLQELGYMGDFTDLAEIAAKAEADGIIIDDANTSDSEAVTNAKAIEDADAKAESIDQIETTASMDIVEETQRLELSLLLFFPVLECMHVVAAKTYSLLPLSTCAIVYREIEDPLCRGFPPSFEDISEIRLTIHARLITITVAVHSSVDLAHFPLFRISTVSPSTVSPHTTVHTHLCFFVGSTSINYLL